LVVGGCVAALTLLGACGDDEPAAAPASSTSQSVAVTTTTAPLVDQVRANLGTLHRSTIRELPDLIALFYHHPDGWAVEDTSLDNGTSWCRHAWYHYQIEDVKSANDFVVRYAPTKENETCVPLGRPLVMHVTGTAASDQGAQLVGEYAPGPLHVTRTICAGSLDDYADVCGESSGLGPPTETPPG
jgi:hypothetical protein